MAQAPQGVSFNTENRAEDKLQGPNVDINHFSAQQYAEHRLQQANEHNIVPPSRTNFLQNNIPLQTIHTDECKSSDEYLSTDEYSVSQIGSISRTVYFPKPARDDTPATYLRTVTRRTLCSQFDQLSVRVQSKAVSVAEPALGSDPDEHIATPLISKFNQTAGEADEETNDYNSPELVAWGQDNGCRRPQIKQGLQQAAHTAVTADAAADCANPAAPKANIQRKHIGKETKPAHPIAAKPPAAKKVMPVPSKPAFGKRLLTTGPSNPATKPVNATTHNKPAIALAGKAAGPVNRPATAAARPLPATSNKQILGGTAGVKAGAIKPFNPPKWVPVSTAATTHISANPVTQQPSLAPKRSFLRKGAGGGARRDAPKRSDAGGIASRFAGMKAKPVEMTKPANQLKGGVRKSVASKNRLHKALAMVGKNPEAGVKMPPSKITKKQTGLPAARAKVVATATVATVAAATAAALNDVTNSQSQISNGTAAQAAVTQACLAPSIGQQSTHTSQKPAMQATVTSESMEPATATIALGEQPAAAVLLVPDNSGCVYEAAYGRAIDAQDDRVLQASVEESALLPELSLHHGCSAALTTQNPVMGELDTAQELMKAVDLAASYKTAESSTMNMGGASMISQAEGSKSLFADSSINKCQASIISCAGEPKLGLFGHSGANVDEANSLKFGMDSNPDIKPRGVNLGGANPQVRNTASGFTFDSPFVSICQAATKPAALALDMPSGAVVDALKMGLVQMDNKPRVEVKAAVESEPSLGCAEQAQCEDVVEKEEAPVESGRSSFCFAVVKGGEPTPVGFNSFFGFAPVNGPRQSTPTLVPSFGLQGQWAKATPGCPPMETSPQVKHDAPPKEEESQAAATGASFLVRPYTPFIRHVMTPESLQPTPTPARSIATIPPSIAPICDYSSAASAAAMIPLPMTPLCGTTPRRGRADRIPVPKKPVSTTTPKRAIVKAPVAEDPLVTPTPKSGAVKVPGVEEPAPSTRGKARRIPISCPPAHRFQGCREVKLEELDENTAHAGSKQVLTLSRATRKDKDQLGAGELVVTPVRRSTRNSESKANPSSNRAKELLEITNYCYSPNPSLRI